MDVFCLAGTSLNMLLPELQKKKLCKVSLQVKWPGAARPRKRETQSLAPGAVSIRFKAYGLIEYSYSYNLRRINPKQHVCRLSYESRIQDVIPSP